MVSAEMFAGSKVVLDSCRDRYVGRVLPKEIGHLTASVTFISAVEKHKSCLLC